MEGNTPERLLWTARKSAGELSISERTLWTKTKAGEIPHVRIGRRVLYSPQDLRDWIDQQKNGGDAQ